MKKRKSPIILISVILICGIIVAIMNQPPPDPTKDKQATDPTQGATSAMPTPEQLAHTEESAGAKAPEKSSNPSPFSKGRSMPLDGGPMNHGGPKMAHPTSTPAPKPMPNDNSISNQWYSPESHTGGK